MSKVRVGIIGAGNIARLHARGYANAPNAELRAVCDANGDRARERAAQWGAAKSYTDYRDLLDDPRSTPSTSSPPTTCTPAWGSTPSPRASTSPCRNRWR